MYIKSYFNQEDGIKRLRTLEVALCFKKLLTPDPMGPIVSVQALAAFNSPCGSHQLSSDDDVDPHQL